MNLLGGLTPAAFLRRHWQRRALFVRRALPGSAHLVGRDELTSLALRDDVESRIVERRGSQWETAHGPFANLKVRARNWTLLVSGVNLHHAGADALLRRFMFVPQARLDDVMVSYAAPGGGVGPHVDSYDVFLIQGPGRRHWTVWHGKRKFQYLAQPGDLLYLPPGWKHDGVALEPCFTYSVGFRAPRGAELGAAFLDWLHERGLPDARYSDRGLAPTARPARIPSDMISFAENLMQRIRWTRGDVGAFLGEYLTAPKQQVVFPPGRKRRRARSGMVRLGLKTQLLYRERRFFMNGEAVTVPAGAVAALRELADARMASGARLARAGLGDLLSEWQRRGYLHFGSG